MSQTHPDTPQSTSATPQATAAPRSLSIRSWLKLASEKPKLDSQELFVVLDARGFYLHVNEAYCQKLGKPRRELIGQSVSPYIHPEDYPRVKAALETLFSARSSEVTVEHRSLFLDGWRWTEWRGIGISGREGKIIEIHGVGRDITDEKLSDIAQRRHHLVFENIWDAVIMMDPHGHIIDWNPSAERQFGFSFDEVNGKTPEFIFSSSCAANFELTEEGLPYFGAHQRRVLPFTQKSGAPGITEVLAKPIKDNRGRCFATLLVCHDLSEQHRAEESLCEHRERFRIAFQNSSLGMLITGLDGTFIEVNRAFAQYLGYQEQELIGKKFVDITHRDDVDTSLGVRSSLLAKDCSSIRFEKRYLHRQGHTVWARLDIGMIRNTSGSPLYFVVQVQDITEQRHSQNLLKQRAEELMIKNEDLEQFAHVITHDLSQPLRLVSSFADLLNSTSLENLTELQRGYTKFIHEGALRALRLIEDLMSYCRLAGTSQVVPLPIPLGDAVEAAIANLKATIESAEAQIRVEGALPVVLGNLSFMTEVFQNLIDNSIKYRSSDRPKISIRAVREENHEVIYFSDNGIGIDPEFSERIFQIFQRLHKRSDYSGNGLGLAIVKRVVQSMGGQIALIPSSHRGTTFRILFPKIGEPCL